MRGFLPKLERDEIIPTVPPVPDTDLGDYFQLIEQRFSNPKIGDTIRRLCLDGSNRQPKFIIPTIADRLKAGGDVTGLALESALWCRYCFGTTDSGAAIEPNDPSWDRLQATSKKAKTDPRRLAGHGGHLRRGRQVAGLCGERFADALDALWRDGTRRRCSGISTVSYEGWSSVPEVLPGCTCLDTPLCPAGQLLLKAGDQARGTRRFSRNVWDISGKDAADLPPEGEMSGRTRGEGSTLPGAIKQRRARPKASINLPTLPIASRHLQSAGGK